MTLVIVVILAALAYPSLQGQTIRGRRTEAIANMLALQHAQEKWRGGHPFYADLVQLNQPAQTANGYYQLDIEAVTATSYVLTATASGSQAQDKICAVLKLSVSSGEALMSSGANASANNQDAPNRRCWNL